MLISGRHRVLGGNATGAPPPEGRRSCRSAHLKASLTFSPACFRLPAVLSFSPSACRSRLFVAPPTADFARPASSWALSSILSPMTNSSRRPRNLHLPVWAASHTHRGGAIRRKLCRRTARRRESLASHRHHGDDPSAVRGNS